MPSFETLALSVLAAATVAILRFVWIDSLRFRDAGSELSAPLPIAVRSRLQAEAVRVSADNEHLPKAA